MLMVSSQLFILYSSSKLRRAFDLFYRVIIGVEKGFSTILLLPPTAMYEDKSL